MIPEPEAISRAWHVLAPELGLPAKTNEAALRIALREADHLADDVYDVPGALLFTFGRYARCFSGFRTMSILVIEWHAKTLGFKLEVGPKELAEILVRVARREMDYEEVRSWVGGRLLPFGG